MRAMGSRPDRAFVSVHYRGHWFYIDDADLDSKTTFDLLPHLVSLQSVTLVAGIRPSSDATLAARHRLSESAARAALRPSVIRAADHLSDDRGILTIPWSIGGFFRAENVLETCGAEG